MSTQISSVSPDFRTPVRVQVESVYYPPNRSLTLVPPDHAQTDERMRAAINRERQARGLPALEPHPALKAAAERQARDCAARDELDHYGSDGSTWADRCRDAGYPGASLMTIGENVAGWQVSAEQAVGDWKESPGHLRTMLDGRWQHCGGASATAASGRSYWVCDFGRLK